MATEPKSRRVMIRKDGDRFRFQSQSDKMPGDIPVKHEYSPAQEAEVAMLLGVIHKRASSAVPERCDKCGTLLDGWGYVWIDGIKKPYCNACYHEHFVKHPETVSPQDAADQQDKQVALKIEPEPNCPSCGAKTYNVEGTVLCSKWGEIPHAPEPLQNPQQLLRCSSCGRELISGMCTNTACPEYAVYQIGTLLPVTGSPTCKGEDYKTIPHFSPGTLTSLYGCAPDATDGDGDMWQEQEPQQLPEGVCPDCGEKMVPVSGDGYVGGDSVPHYACHNPKCPDYRPDLKPVDNQCPNCGGKWLPTSNGGRRCPECNHVYAIEYFAGHQLDDQDPVPHSLTPPLYAVAPDEVEAGKPVLVPICGCGDAMKLQPDGTWYCIGCNETRDNNG